MFQIGSQSILAWLVPVSQEYFRGKAHIVRILCARQLDSDARVIVGETRLDSWREWIELQILNRE